MKRKLISAVLVTVMAAGMITGCSGKNSSIKNNVKTLEKEELKVSNAQLSSPDYEFEKEYAYGDFNAHSKADAERQDGIDTFEDKDIVFQDISYDQLIQLLGQEGNYLIQLSGSWCHNSRAMSPYVNAYAKEYGIDTIYSYDFNVDNGDDGSMFVRMSNEKTTLGTKYNYMYGEFVSNTSGKCPIMYAFEEMVDRDSKGLYVKETDDEGNPVLDKEGNQVRKYVTDEYTARLKQMFEFIKTNNIQFSKYTKETYIRDTFNSYGTEVFGSDEQINIYPITYRQLEWLLDEKGNSLVLIGGSGNEKTRAIIGQINQYAVKNNVRVYMYDPQIDGGITVDKWGYTQTTSICEENSPIAKMYTGLIDRHLTNLTAAKTTEDGYALIQEPYFFAYNKDAKDEDGFAAPITASVELPYTTDSEKRYYIGKEKNMEACNSQIETVFESYAQNVGIELEK